jgi:ADP-heptose:LPS heptosyltransferase
VSVGVAGAALAIHPGALGDVLLAIPALRALRRGGVQLGVAAQARIARLLVTLGEADEALDFEALGLSALFGDGEAPRLPRVDRLVCWFGARDGGFVARLGRVVPGAIVAPSVATGEVWRHLLSTVDGEADVATARVPDDLIEEARAALRACGWDGRAPVVLVHPGAGSPAKCWPAEGFAAALAGVDARIVVHRGPADAEAVAALARRVPGALVLDAPPLGVLAGALACSAAYVGNDSGVSHLAAAVGAPSVILYGPANLPWRPWAPAPHVRVVTFERAVKEDVDAVTVALRRLLG